MASQNEKVVYRKLFCWLTISNFLYIIVLLILAGISIAMLTGENGILTKADTATRETDVTETKEQIKLEIMSHVDERGNYNNTNVISAVKKITGKDILEKEETVESKKGNKVDISDLWIQDIVFTINGYTLNAPNGITWTDWIIDKREAPEKEVGDFIYFGLHQTTLYYEKNDEIRLWDSAAPGFYVYLLDESGNHVKGSDKIKSQSYTDGLNT